MNTLILKTKISRLINYQNSLGIQFHDSMFPEKTSRYTTRINGSTFEKWKDKLSEGDVVELQGNISEAMTGPRGTFIVVYNPVILDVYKMVLKHIDSDDVELSTEQELELQ